ncbi:hypothetical protein CDV36_011763 [Fusarium kuroshium]|uniref:DNA-directed RNA polymerase III subunit RPC9 n=4 Tax=Fusarium solani species complex TaxID=232080 RepID=A0A3M2RTL6_9HYPO|nr:hypothetical protein CDV36_011763 [Fusarium kuroshium]RSL82475.1 hypothetical protein CEP51_005122 [Fusarium floridanum]RSL84948.1 hypothetical protein CEP52_016283 [Fusarium oligoseptatum]RSL97147.1 hypothetical protein CDV31_013169 [Fusarium ambrosium]
MKILESQAAVLSNWEVYEHLTEQKERYKKTKHRGPQNFEDLVRYLLNYLRSNPNPLSEDPIPYTEGCITQLLERLRPFNLAKSEVIMIINLRPSTPPVLGSALEDMYERFTAEQQEEMVTIIAEVLGPFGQQEAEADASMADA